MGWGGGYFHVWESGSVIYNVLFNCVGACTNNVLKVIGHML